MTATTVFKARVTMVIQTPTFHQVIKIQNLNGR
jgi:hypothetical protein